MNTETLAARTTRVMQNARISPRILAGLTPLHYTTVYAVINGEAPSRPVTQKVLEDTLESLERLLAENKLPLVGKMTHKEMTGQINALLGNT